MRFLRWLYQVDSCGESRMLMGIALHFNFFHSEEVVINHQISKKAARVFYIISCINTVNHAFMTIFDIIKFDAFLWVLDMCLNQNQQEFPTEKLPAPHRHQAPPSPHDFQGCLRSPWPTLFRSEKLREKVGKVGCLGTFHYDNYYQSITTLIETYGTNPFQVCVFFPMAFSENKKQHQNASGIFFLKKMEEIYKPIVTLEGGQQKKANRFWKCSKFSWEMAWLLVKKCPEFLHLLTWQ